VPTRVKSEHTPPPAPARILIVDDEEEERRDLSNMVRALGYVPEVAANGEEALEKLRRCPVDVIVTDMMMPRMNGCEFLRILQQGGDRTPAVLVTGFGHAAESLAIARDVRTFWMLEKPAQQQVLAPLLARAIRQGKHTAKTS
jgi:CheY-like chemotaxis protein